MATVTIGGIKVKHKWHHKRGDCRCSICVQYLATLYIGNNRPITTALRCHLCNHVLSHPQWIWNGGNSFNGQRSVEYNMAIEQKDGIGFVCCSCLPVMEKAQRKLRQRGYHVRAGIMGADARRNRKSNPIEMGECPSCSELIRYASDLPTSQIHMMGYHI